MKLTIYLKKKVGEGALNPVTFNDLLTKEEFNEKIIDYCNKNKITSCNFKVEGEIKLVTEPVGLGALFG